MADGIFRRVRFHGAEPLRGGVHAAIIVFALTGFKLRAAIMPMLLLLVICNIGFSIAVIPVLSEPKTVTWVIVSWYMAVDRRVLRRCRWRQTRSSACPCSSAAICSPRRRFTRRDHRIFHSSRGCPTCSVISVGRAAHSRTPMCSARFWCFRLWSRCSGRYRAAKRMLRGGALLAVFVLALLLSFSRAAWGQFAFGAASPAGAHIRDQVIRPGAHAHRRDGRRRDRLALPVHGGNPVARLRSRRCSRNARVWSKTMIAGTRDGSAGIFCGFMLALESPFGIGPLQFAKIFTEDPHNSYLNAFMSGGWISGFSYPALIATHAAGRLAVRVRRDAVAADLPRRSMSPLSALPVKASSSTAIMATLFPAPWRALGPHQRNALSHDVSGAAGGGATLAPPLHGTLDASRRRSVAQPG